MMDGQGTSSDAAVDAELLATAMRIATAAHDGQRDKAGAAYVSHPLRVAARLLEHGAEVVAAGLLHDVVEDSQYSFEDLVAAGIQGS